MNLQVPSPPPSGARPSRTPWLAPVALFALFALYALLGLSGYGTDNDTYGMLRTGTALVRGEGYVPSRSPGYPLPEIALGLAAPAGGAALANLASALLGATAVACFYLLLRGPAGRRTALWASAAVALNPWWILAASSSMDYVYAQAFLLLGLVALRKGRAGLAALCLTACAASRLTFFPLGLLAFATAVALPARGAGPSRARLAAWAAAFAAGTFATYFAVYLASGPSMFQVYAGKTVGFFTLDGFSSAKEYLARFVYKNILLWGLPAFAGAMGALCIAWLGRRREPLWTGMPRPVPYGIAAGLVYCQLMFLRLPIEASYLLPFLFGVVFLLAGVPRPRFFLGWVVVGHVLFSLIAPNFIKIRYDRDSWNGRMARGVAFEPGLQKGVVVRNVLDRPAAEAFYLPRFGLDELRRPDAERRGE